MIYLLLLGLVAVNVELDIFLPMLPQMQDHFFLHDGQIEWILSLNFIGLCLSGFISGWLSDSFGRKKVIMWGLAIFVLGSIGCLLTDNFGWFLFFRFIQGIGCGAPATISFASVCDIHNSTEAAKIIAIFNGVITGATVGAPILGVFLGSFWGWRANFTFIAILSVVAFISIGLFYKDTLKQTKKLDAAGLLNDLNALFSSSEFWKMSLIPIVIYSSIILFLSQFPLLARDHRQMTTSEYGWLQAMIMAAFVTGSVLFGSLIKHFSLSKLNSIGINLILASTLCLGLIVAFSQNYLLITVSMMGFNLGAALVIAVYVSKVMDTFSSTKGLTSSLVGSLRMFVCGGFVALGTLLYNGTFYPLCIIMLLGTGLVYSLANKDLRASSAESKSS